MLCRKQEVRTILLWQKLVIRSGPDDDAFSGEALRFNKNLTFGIINGDRVIELVAELKTYRRYGPEDSTVNIDAFLISLAGKKADKRRIRIDYCPVSKTGIIFV